MAQTTWATTADVLAYTGVEVSTAQLNLAQGTIDIHARRTYDDVTRIGARDLYWLKLATAYQAAWLLAQPDLFQRMDIDTLGQNRSITKFNANAMKLGPLAKQALSCVSWIKSRSLHTQTSFTDGIGVLGTDPLSAGSDDLYAWDPVE